MSDEDEDFQVGQITRAKALPIERIEHSCSIDGEYLVLKFLSAKGAVRTVAIPLQLAETFRETLDVSIAECTSARANYRAPRN